MNAFQVLPLVTASLIALLFLHLDKMQYQLFAVLTQDNTVRHRIEMNKKCIFLTNEIKNKMKKNR